MGKSKKVTVGYKYYLGMHMILCHGPIDFIKSMSVDKRVAFNRNSSGGRINIDAPGLFGGQEREGGVVGPVDIEMGEITQTRNDYLQERLGEDIPAFRGVVGVVLRQVYLGVNPYLKPWAFRAQRIFATSEGEAQWNPSKAAISSGRSTVNFLSETFDQGLSGYLEYAFMTNTDSRAGLNQYEISGGALLIKGGYALSSTTLHPSIYKALPQVAPLNLVSARFKLNSLGENDNGSLILRDSEFNQVFGFGVARDSDVDSLQRPNISFIDSPGSFGNPVGSSTVTVGVWYKFEVNYNPVTLGFICVITREDNGTVFGSLEVENITRNDISSLHFENDASGVAASGSALFDDVTVVAGDIQYDMNPAHIIRECLLNSTWGMGYLQGDVDETSFANSASTLFNEGMGISLLWDKQMPIEDFVNEIIRHIDAALYVDRVTGKFTLRLIREDYVKDDLLELGPNNIQKVSNYARIDPGNSINSVTVTYWDFVTGENDTVTADDIALIQSYGSVVNTTVQYPGFTNSTLASRVALRDLQSLSFPLLSATIECDRTASNLNIGDAFKFVWPEYHPGFIIMRVNQISFGDGKKNRIKIVASEDVFSLPVQGISAVEDRGFVELGGAPQVPLIQIIVESPYYELVQLVGQTEADRLLTENVEIGYVQFAATRPDNGINASVFIDSGLGFEEASNLDFAPYGTLSSNVGRLDSTFIISNSEDLDQLDLGSHGQVGNELFSITGINLETGEMTVSRGILDTIPEEHLLGASVVFWDVYSATDGIEYVAGETILARVLTNSSAGQLPLASGVSVGVTMDQRAFRPYRPAGLAVNGEYDHPPGTNIEYPVNITWVSRNRLQETAGTFLTWTGGSITPESGTTYRIVIESLNSNFEVEGTITTINQAGISYTLNESDIVEPWNQNPLVKVTVSSLRDGLYSFTSPSVIVNNPFKAPSNLTAQYLPLTAPVIT